MSWLEERQKKKMKKKKKEKKNQNSETINSKGIYALYTFTSRTTIQYLNVNGSFVWLCTRALHLQFSYSNIEISRGLYKYE